MDFYLVTDPPKWPNACILCKAIGGDQVDTRVPLPIPGNGPAGWNDLFVTSQGSASARFQRAVERRNLFEADIAAKEMGGLSLIHALDYPSCWQR
jgi:hypothetical protein